MLNNWNFIIEAAAIKLFILIASNTSWDSEVESLEGVLISNATETVFFSKRKPITLCTDQPFSDHIHDVKMYMQIASPRVLYKNQQDIYWII